MEKMNEALDSTEKVYKECEKLFEHAEGLDEDCVAKLLKTRSEVSTILK